MKIVNICTIIIELLVQCVCVCLRACVCVYACAHAAVG